MYLSLEGIDDKLQGMWIHTLNTLLHHMITVLIFDTFKHVTI